MVELCVKNECEMYQDLYRMYIEGNDNNSLHVDSSALQELKKSVLEQSLIASVIKNDSDLKRMTVLFLQTGFDDSVLDDDKRLSKFADSQQIVTKIREYLMEMFQSIVQFHKKLLKTTESNYSSNQITSVDTMLKDYRNLIKKEILSYIQTYEDELQFYHAKYIVGKHINDEFDDYLSQMIVFLEQFTQSQALLSKSLSENIWKVSTEYLQLYHADRSNDIQQKQFETLLQQKSVLEKERSQQLKMISQINQFYNQISEIRHSKKSFNRTQKHYDDSISYLGAVNKSLLQNSVEVNQTIRFSKQKLAEYALLLIKNSIQLQINHLSEQISNYFEQQCFARDLDMPVIQLSNTIAENHKTKQPDSTYQEIPKQNLDELIALINLSFIGKYQVSSIGQILNGTPVFNCDQFDVQIDKPELITTFGDVIKYVDIPTTCMRVLWDDHQILVLLAVFGNALFFGLEQNKMYTELTFLCGDMFELLLGCIPNIAIYIGQHKDGKYNFVKHQRLQIQSGPSLIDGGLNITLSDISFVYDTITQFQTQLKFITQRELKSLNVKLSCVDLKHDIPYIVDSDQKTHAGEVVK